MNRIMTTIYVEPQQLKGLRKTVFEMKEELPSVTQSDLIRVAIDGLLRDWRKPENKEEIIKAVRRQQK